jgi:hypothetical protein
MAWYRRDKAAVAEALRRGERPDLATTMASGPLDELVALHEELGIFAISSEKVLPDRLRKGLPSLSQWLQFDLIAHAFEASNKLLLHDLSVPLIEIVAS